MADEKEMMTCAFPSWRSVGNPFQTETPFGKAVIIARGNVFAERDRYEAALRAILDYDIGRAAEIASAALDAQ